VRHRIRPSQMGASAHSHEPVVRRIRERWPQVRIQLRGDAGFCREKLLGDTPHHGQPHSGTANIAYEQGRLVPFVSAGLS
jgi:hypothetical protein